MREAVPGAPSLARCGARCVAKSHSARCCTPLCARPLMHPRFWLQHFFYTLQPTPPYRLLATSEEFCIGAEQDATDCESVQFVSGIEIEARKDAGKASGREGGGGDRSRAKLPSQLLLSYGINDCEARIARMPLEQVWAMLRPLAGEIGVCGSA